MWIELVRIIVGLWESRLIFLDINSSCLWLFYRHFLTEIATALKLELKMIFRRICEIVQFPISLLYFSIILSSRRLIKMDIFLNLSHFQGMQGIFRIHSENVQVSIRSCKAIVSRGVIWLSMNDNFQVS